VNLTVSCVLVKAKAVLLQKECASLLVTTPLVLPKEKAPPKRGNLVADD
jgi:hypothetical protein